MSKFYLENFFNFIDYFAQSIIITLDMKKKFSTFFGGILSLLIYCLIFALIITNGINLLNKYNAKTTATNLHQIKAPLLNITELNSIFVTNFYTSDLIPFLDPTYFDIEISQLIIKADLNGNINLSYVPLDKVNCSMYFDFFKQNKIEKDFTQNNMFQGICFDNHKYNELVLGGKFGTEYFSNIKYTMKKCTNKTTFNEEKEIKNYKNQTNIDTSNNVLNNIENRKGNIVCKPSEEIEAKIKGGFFEFFYFDYNVDLNNYDTPIYDYLNVYFILLDPNTKKFVDLYFKTVSLTSDSGLIFEELKTSNVVIFDYFREQIESQTDTDNIIDLYVNSSNNVVNYTRSYLKIQEFAASIGGLMQILILIGNFLTMSFNHHRMNEKMINTLFIVKDGFEKNKSVNQKLNKVMNFSNKRLMNINKINNNKNEIDLNNNENPQNKMLIGKSLFASHNNSNNILILKDEPNQINYYNFMKNSVIINDELKNKEENLKKEIQNLKIQNDKKKLSDISKIFELRNMKKKNSYISNSPVSLDLDYSNKKELIKSKNNENILRLSCKKKKKNNENFNIFKNKKMNEIEISYPNLDNLKNISTNMMNVHVQAHDSVHKNDFQEIGDANNFINDSNNYENKKDQVDLENSNFENAKKISHSGSNKNFYKSLLDQTLRPISNNNIKENDSLNNNKMQSMFIDDKMRLNFFQKIGNYKNENELVYKLKWFEILFINLCSLTKLCKKKKKLFNLASLKLYKYLDFLNILTYMQEFNKLKKIYFSKKELELFNNTKIPIISYENIDKNESKLKNKFIKEKKNNDYLEMLFVYKRFSEQSDKDEKIKRLVQNIEPNLKKIFDEVLKNF